MDSDSVSYGPSPGFLYSDGMSGGTGLIFVPPWHVVPRRARRRRRPIRNPQRPPQDPRELPYGIRRGLRFVVSFWGVLSCNPPRRRQGGFGGA